LLFRMRLYDAATVLVFGNNLVCSRQFTVS